MAVFTGTDGADSLTGSDLIDRLAGGGGDDVLSGRDGSDVVEGGAGNDVLYGWGEADRSPDAGLINAVRVATGLASPLFATAAPGQPDLLYVAEKNTGKIQVLDLGTGQLRPTPFLDLPQSDFSNDGERGLLGLAFHPDYAQNGRAFIYVTTPSGDIQVREYARSADGLTLDPAARVVITVPHPTFNNHNGGSLLFGPDGMLYLNTGDGGGGGDPNNNAQNLNSLLGKVLRLDVNGDSFPGDAGRNYAVPADNPFVGREGADEIFAYGLRNPYRASFDRGTGDFYIGDVGEREREELDVIVAGSRSGQNFGWRVKEGTLDFNTSTPPSGGPLVGPVLEYGRDPGGGRSITGGVVNRGPGGAQGVYVFGDFISGNIFTARVTGGFGQDFRLRTSEVRADAGTLNLPAAFAEDTAGRVYVVGFDGEIHRLDFSAAAGDANDVLNGGDGDDTAFGGAGDDILIGEGGGDALNGGLGADVLDGGDGDDRLFGDAGADRLTGGLGADDLQGGAGADLLNGGDGRDVLLGQAGDDVLYGAADDDTLRGEDGADTLVGGGGNDDLAGGAADDVLAGEDGDDVMAGEAGADALYGGEGSDLANGGDGRDTLLGQNGDDLLYGAGDGDTLRGEAGRDTLVGGDGDDDLAGGDQDDLLAGDAGRDLLVGEAGADVIYGGADDDLLAGREGADTLVGGAGADVAYGGDDGDVLAGEAGADTLVAGSGDDALFGGDDADVLAGEAGADTLDGGAGADTLFGGEDADTLLGRAGADSLLGQAGADRFLFMDLGDSSAGAADAVLDFDRAAGDLIDIRAIDADAAAEGDQAFTVVGAFDGQAGRATLTYEADSNATVLALDVDGDRNADFTLIIVGNAGDGSTGFVL